jgi:hypothetical protein
MDDTGAMGGGDRRQHLFQDRERLDRFQPPLVGQHVAQGPAAYVLHHQVREPVVSALVVDGDDVGMRETGDRLGFPSEPLDEARVVGLAGMDDLHRHGALQALVRGGVDGRHSAARDATPDPVAPVDERADPVVRDPRVHRLAV